MPRSPAGSSTRPVTRVAGLPPQSTRWHSRPVQPSAAPTSIGASPGAALDPRAQAASISPHASAVVSRIPTSVGPTEPFVSDTAQAQAPRRRAIALARSYDIIAKIEQHLDEADDLRLRGR